MKEMSDPQKVIYKYMVEYQRTKGYPPSVREICSAVGLSSTSTVHGHLTRLEKKGYICRDKTKPRAIEILALRQESNQLSLPVLGRVAAGQPILAQQNIEHYMALPASIARNESCFVLNVRGNSMVEAGILDGDQIVVMPGTHVENGDIVVAMVQDPLSGESTATVKRFFKETNRIRLQPENSTMAPIYYTEVTVLGKVVSLLRVLS